MIAAVFLCPSLALSLSWGSAPLAWRAAPRTRPTKLCVQPRLGEDLLEQCGASPTKLASLLSKDDLKACCAAHRLAVSGTKPVLASRLIESLLAQSGAEVAGIGTHGGGGNSGSSGAGGVAAALPYPSRAPTAARMPASMPSSTAPTVETAATDRRSRASGGEGGAPTSSGADLELTVLGSGACNPSPSRGASCTALRVRDSYWLFDVGEGTQVQLQRCAVRPGKIDRIFITHAHGDHCFGLPGLLCLIARGRDRAAPPLQIYGPHGIRAFVRVALSFTGTRMLPPYVVHELHGIPLLSAQAKASPPPPPITTRPVQPPPPGERAKVWGEVPGGSDLNPAADGSWWTLLANDELTVAAAPVSHTVPCVGYVIAERPKEGRLLAERVVPHIEANRDALRESGMRDPMRLLKQVKLLGPDDQLTLPDGTVLRGSEVIGERRRGRKVVLLGDCSDASLTEDLARGADLLVHEATNSYLPSRGDTGGGAALERETARHGHSTPQMAGRFAARIGARALLLTHFSQRYHPACRGVMREIASLAARAAGLPDDRVAPAYDTLAVPIWQTDRQKPLLPAEAVACGPERTAAMQTEEEAVAAAAQFEAQLEGE